VRRILTDNGSGYLTHVLAQLCASARVRHLRTRPYTPRTNGKAERFIQTLLREWAYIRAYHTSTVRLAALPHWLHYYNVQRRHAGLHDRPPISRLSSVRADNLVRLHTSVRVRSESFRWHGGGSIHGTSVGAAPWLKRPLTSEQECDSSPGRRGIGPNPAPAGERQGVRCEHGSSSASRWRRLTGEDANPPAGRRQPREAVVPARHADEQGTRPRSRRLRPREADRGGRLPQALPPPAGGSRVSIRDVHAQLRHQPCRQGIERFPDAVARGVPRASCARRSGASDTSTPAQPRRSP
jgi:hypothetical protein